MASPFVVSRDAVSPTEAKRLWWRHHGEEEEEEEEEEEGRASPERAKSVDVSRSVDDVEFNSAASIGSFHWASLFICLFSSR